MDQAEFQNPKPTTDGKQKTDPSRSKVKRTSHSDDDGSESQAHQPPLKRQTSQRTKQAGKSVGTNTDDPDPNNSHTVDAFSSQTALQNELVLKSLFRYVNRTDLLSCRIVNKKWQDEATKELRRRKLVIRFAFQSQGSQMSRNIAFENICRRLGKCRTPSLLSSVQVKRDLRTDLGSAGLTSIFNTVGNHIKNLTLRLNYSRKRCSIERSSLMAHLHNLLFRQAPNLEFLEIKFDFSFYWEPELETLDELDQNQNDANELQLLPNLKTFIVDGTPPPKFIADVINAAVNLRSVGGVWSTLDFAEVIYYSVGHFTGAKAYSSACIKYFLGSEGRNKIHLLKRFRVYEASDPDVEQIDEDGMKLIKTFLKEYKQNLQLETFECVSRLFDNYPTINPRFVDVVNQILEYSSGSLLKLRIEPVECFEDLLVIPRLPKLKEICFDCGWSSEVGLEGGSFLPPEFNMNMSFPNISTIVFLKCAVFLLRQFLNCMETEMTEPVPSVRYIILSNPGKGTGALPLAPECHRVFPNLLSISYVDKEKYYNI